MDFLQGARQELIGIYDVLGQPNKTAKFRAELAANQPEKIDRPGAASYTDANP